MANPVYQDPTWTVRDLSRSIPQHRPLSPEARAWEVPLQLDIPDSDSFSRRMAILKAMDVLMEEIPLDKLNVTDVCHEAGICRATFYRYFSDKYAVIQWYTKRLNNRGIYQTGRTLTWYGAGTAPPPSFCPSQVSGRASRLC